MKLNGASKAAGMALGFLTLLLAIGGSYMDTRERLAEVRMETRKNRELTILATVKIERQVDDLRTDIIGRVIRIEDRLYRASQ